MKRMGFIFLLILSFQVVIYAQDTAELPDISQNFTDYMTLVDVRDLPPPVTTQVYNTRPIYDDITREIRIYDDETETWLTFPYPEGVEYIQGASWYPNGLFVVNTIRNRGAYSMGVDPAGDWILDLETGEYTRPELLCGEWRAEAGQGIWIGYQLEDEGVLCHTETGEQISPDFNYIRGVYPSPNNELVAMFAYDGVYTYTFSTEELIRVGQTHSYDFESIYWLGNEWLMIRQTQMADMSFPWIYYSLANAYQADSMEQVTYTLKPGDLDLLDNPRRYEWVDMRGEDCLLVQMRVSDGHREEFNIGDICSRGTLLGDSDERLATMMITEDSEWEGHPHPIGRQIVRFNPYTGEQRILLEGEIESLYDITFDNHYALLVMDDSGQVDMLTDEQLQFYFYDHERENMNFRYVILDLFHETIVYETPVTTARYFNDYWYDNFDSENGTIQLNGSVVSYPIAAPRDSLFYMGNDTFILGREGENWQSSYSMIRIGTETVEQPIGIPLLLMGNGRHLIIQRGDENNYSFVVYDVVTGEEAVILNIEAQFQRDYSSYQFGQDNRYSLSFIRGDAADTFIVRVWDTETQMSREYFLQLPDEN